MRRKRRSSYEIYRDVLKICLVKTLFTHIMYKCNMSFYQTKKYIGKLIHLGLLESGKMKNSVRNFYLTTNKGKTWLRTIKEIKRLEGGENQYE